MNESYNSQLIAGIADVLPNVMMLAQSLPNDASFPTAGQAIPSSWTSSMLIPIILGAIGYLLIQHGIYRSRSFFAGGIVACFVSVIAAIGYTPATVESAILMGFCALATGGGVGFLVAREPIYAALGFTTAVLSICGVLFMQSALFIAAATMIIYAGATIIIFLFVLMFAQRSEVEVYDVQLNHPLVAATIGAILLSTITMCVTGESAILAPKVDLTRPLSLAALPDNLRSDTSKMLSQESEANASVQSLVPKSTAGLGRSLYTDYLLAVELAGTVLLVATIGAIALAQRSTEGQL